MNTTPDASPIDAAEPVTLVKDISGPAEPVTLLKATTKVDDGKVSRPGSDILGQLLDEHPEWQKLLDDIDAGAVAEYQLPSFLDDEPSLRVQFGHEMAAHVAGYQSDDRMLENWQRDAWVRCNDAITVSNAPAALR